MKKILILLFVLPFFAKAQLPTLNRDTTYFVKAIDANVGVFREAIYLPKLSTSDTALFVQVDMYGKLILRRFATTDTQYLRRDININTAQGIANAAAIQQRLLISDTTGIRLQPIPGTNMSITGTYPFLTFNSLSNTYQRTAIPFANASGVLTSDSTRLSYSSDYVYIGGQFAATGSQSGILMNGGRGEINSQFSGMYFNVGSGKAGGGTYDASKGYIFQNRGNTIFQLSTSAITGGFNTAAFNANVSTTGTVKISGGNPQIGKVLTSIDALGNATWENLPILKGQYSATGSATTTFTVTLGETQLNNTYNLAITPTSVMAGASYYISAKTTTTFDITYLTAVTGAINLDWTLFR